MKDFSFFDEYIEKGLRNSTEKKKARKYDFTDDNKKSIQFTKLDSVTASSKYLNQRYKIEVKQGKFTLITTRKEEIKIYKKVMRMFFKKLCYEIITTGRKVILPKGLGSLQAVKVVDEKAKKTGLGMNLNFNAMNKVKKRTGKIRHIYHNLTSTNGYWCKVLWSKDEVKDKCTNKKLKDNINVFEFNLTRPNLRINKDHRTHPRITLYDFFRDKGYKLYRTE